MVASVGVGVLHKCIVRMDVPKLLWGLATSEDNAIDAEICYAGFFAL